MSIEFGAAKAVAFSELVRVLGLMNYTNNLKKVGIDEGRLAADEETVRFNIEGRVGPYDLTGEVVVKCYGGAWRLYCAASYFFMRDDQHDFWFDPETNTTGIRFCGEEHSFISSYDGISKKIRLFG